MVWIMYTVEIVDFVDFDISDFSSNVIVKEALVQYKLVLYILYETYFLTQAITVLEAAISVYDKIVTQKPPKSKDGNQICT